MRIGRWLARRLDVLFRKRRAEAELDEEIRAHIELETEENLRAGMGPEEARRRALVAFGGVERFKEEVRDVRGARMLDDLVQDLRLVSRRLPKEPVFVLAVLLTLGTGIGGNVAVFAVLDATVFAALPYPEPERLLVGRSLMDGERLGPVVSAHDFVDYRERLRTVETLGAIAPFPQRVTLTGEGTAERPEAVSVSHDFFRALGVDPLLGRHFSPAEERPDGPAVAMLDHGYWQRRFGGDPDVVGRSLVLNGVATHVVGVMPEGFHFYVDTDLWYPFRLGRGMAGGRQFHNFLLVGRLGDGVTWADARADARSTAAELRSLYPENQNESLLISPLHEYLVAGLVPVLRVLGAAVVLLLVVACANVAGLLLARGRSRRQEFAVRAAIGARNGRLARQLLTENTVLGLAAGAVGVAIASAIQRALMTVVSFEAVGGVEEGLSSGSLAFALGLSVSTVLLFGLLPALRVARSDPASDLRGRAGADRGSHRFRSGLVIVQVALTTVLLAVSGLLLRSFLNARGVDLGFDERSLLTATVSLPSGAGHDREGRITFFETLHERVGGLPGVTSLSMATQLPVRDGGNNVSLALPEDPESDFNVHTRTVWPGYFAGMGIPVLEGRALRDGDGEGGAPVIVLSRATARRLFGEERAVGRDVLAENGGLRRFRVVGVVGDVVLSDPTWGTDYAMYFPYHERAPGRMGLAVRVAGDPTPVVTTLRATVGQLDPDVPVDAISTMEEVVSRALSSQRAIALVVALFAGTALLMATVGLYGVMAYHVASRTREIGIRIALGASLSAVSRRIVQRGLALAVGGLVLGALGVLAGGRMVQHLLFQVASSDPATLAAVAVFTVTVAVVASGLPARRAARVDPTEAFRAE